MNRTQIIALANAVQSVRPDWQQSGIVSQLTILASNWAGSDGALSAHAMTIAAAPQAHTPGAFNATPPEPIAQPSPSRHSFREPSCHICSRNRSQCINQREREIRRGIPDPHDFETQDGADARTSRRGA